MKRFLLRIPFLLAGITVPVACFPDTIPSGIQDRIWRDESYLQRFAGEVYANPAARYDRQEYSLTDVSARWHYRNENRAYLPEKGDGGDRFSFNAKSYLRRKTYVLWGNAGYDNARIRNVKWNETSDSELLYPYLMADSVGGDLRQENYSFAGGYAGRSGRFSWGAQLSYRAAIAYRGIDPRPKNVTSDLSLALGGSLLVGNDYSLDIGLWGEKYKQSNEIKFYSELGASKVYHLTGLATHYVRFAGNHCDTYYNGYKWGGDLGIHPKGISGWRATGSFRRFSFEKIISSLNELPMASVAEYEYRGEVGYKTQVSSRSAWGIASDAVFSDRTGTEHIFGDAVGNVYPQIASADQYKAIHRQIALSGFYETALRHGFSFAVQPHIYFSHAESRYTYPKRQMTICRIGADLSAYLSMRLKRSVWRIDLEARYDSSPHSELYFTEDGETDPVLTPVWQYDYRNLSSEFAEFQIGLSYAYRITSGYVLQCRGGWSYGRYKTGIDRNCASVALSFLF